MLVEMLVQIHIISNIKNSCFYCLQGKTSCFFLLGIISECLLDTLYANNMKYLTASTQLELDLNW